MAKLEAHMVGVVVVSHSTDIARGVAELAGQMAAEVVVEPAGGTDDGRLGTDEGRVREAIHRADSGGGVVVLGDLGSSILTVRHLLDRLAEAGGNGHVRLADAPLVEGALAAAVAASAGVGLGEVVRAAEEARDVRKL